MKINKVINNNVVSSFDDESREIIVMGKGIGFQKKTGDILDESKIEKKFHLSDELQSRFEQLAREIPYENMRLADKIITQAKECLGSKLSKSIYITLTDHLNFALERNKKGIEFQNALLWKIKKYYPKEYNAASKAIQIVKMETGVSLSEDEVGFIALHFINAEVDAQFTQSLNMPEMVKEILNIVKYTLIIEFEEDNINYERFVTHLKYFVQRAVAQQYYDEESAAMFEGIVASYPQEYECALKVKSYMEQKTNYEVSNEEIMYLTVHINRVRRRLKK